MRESREKIQKIDENLKYALNSNIAASEFLRGIKDAQTNSQQKQEQHFLIENNRVKKSSNKSKKQKEKLEDMKNITKRDDGRYMIRKVVDGQRITLYANTQAEAREKLQNIKKRKVKTKQQKPTLQEYCERWYEIYKEPFVKHNTKLEICRILNIIYKSMGDIRINKLTTQIIQIQLNKMTKNRTKEKVCTYLNAVLQKAADTNIINLNPFNAVILDKKIKSKRNALTYLEQEKLLEAIKGTNIEHEIMTYLMCGCRPSELPTNENFDFKNNIINVYGTKNKNAEHRAVRMSQNFADYMMPYLETNTMKSKDYVMECYKNICKKIKLQENTLYTLRHTFATNHFTLGTPAKRVQTWLGHGSVQLTLDTYTDIDETSSKEKIIKLYNNFYYVQ